MDSGRLYVDADGKLAKQTIKSCPGVVGPVTSNDMTALQHMTLQQLQETDPFGCSAVMLAALYCNWDALSYLLHHPTTSMWEQVRAAQHMYRCCSEAVRAVVTLPLLGYCPRMCRHILRVQRGSADGMSALHYIAANPPRTQIQAYSRIIMSLPTNLPPHVINARDKHGRVPLGLAILNRNEAMFEWLLGHGADVRAQVHQTPSEYMTFPEDESHPVINAINSLQPICLKRLLELGAALPRHWMTISIRTEEQLTHLVQYGASPRRLPILFHNSPIWMSMHLPSSRVSRICQSLVAAFNESVSRRRLLVIAILAGRLQPHLTRDALHLICFHADLLPFVEQAAGGSACTFTICDAGA